MFNFRRTWRPTKIFSRRIFPKLRYVVYIIVKFHSSKLCINLLQISKQIKDILMAAKQEINKNIANNINCSLCTKFIKILKHNPEGETDLKCDECGDDYDPVVALCVDCELYLCQDCNKVHSKKYKTHDIVALGQSTGKIPALLSRA